VLKQFTGGGNMQFDRKNRDPISVRPTAKLMCAWNTRPRIKDKTNGMWRRLIVVPFYRSITRDDRVKGMDEVDWWMRRGEVPGILRWAITGLDRLREQGDFTESDVIDKATEEYREEVNPTLRFLKEHVTKITGDFLLAEIQKETCEQAGINIDELYEKYRAWCTVEGVKAISKNNLGIQVKRKFGDLKVRRRNSGERYSFYRLLAFRKYEEDSEETAEENNF
jgi:putative DNA primase/helicase